MQVNKNNFLIWFNDQIDPGLPEAPFQYHRDRTSYGANPVGVPTEAIGFYVNNPDGVFDENVADDLKLDIYNSKTGDIAATDIWEVEKHVVSQVLDIADNVVTEEWNPWSLAVLPSLNNGHYFFKLRGNLTTIVTPETPAAATLDCDVTIPTDEESRLYVDDPQFGEVDLCNLQREIGESIGDFVIRLADAINAGTSGYTAVASGTDLVVTARENLGDLINGELVVARTITSTWSSATFAGGVDAVTETNETNLLYSSPFYVINDATWVAEHTVYCRFRHDRYFYGVKYSEIPSFYNQFRLVMGKVDQQTESAKEVYWEVTTGKPRTYENYLHLMQKFETYYLTPEQHIAAGIMCEMDYVELNGYRYRLKNGGAYKQTPGDISKLSKGEVELYLEEFSTANRC